MKSNRTPTLIGCWAAAMDIVRSFLVVVRSLGDRLPTHSARCTVSNSQVSACDRLDAEQLWYEPW
jgi:hypothetical protein